MICLDRFIARYYPYAVEVMPKIKKQFEGFTVYKNTISFGPRTIVAAPAMYGGYEYVAYEMNKREGLVKEKMAEAYSIMPKMLANEGYNVAVSYIPYEEYTDLNYATYSNIKKVQIHPKSEIIDNNIRETKNRIKRNFVYYSIMKVFPLGLKNFIYEEGNYIYNPNVKEYKNSYSSLFLNHFVILNKLNNLFNVIDDNSNNAFIMHNETTHEPCILPMPDFYPSNEMGNERLEDMGLVVDGLKFDGNYKQLNVIIASLMQVGNFLDYLRENCVYDNTRIIIVGDHGSAYNSWDKVSAIEEINENNYNNEYGSYNKIASCYPQFYNPILMYKDFDSKIYDESNEFMTNADTPYLLLNGISKTMENPYTGNKITMDYKYDNNEYHITHREWDGHEKNLIEDNTIIDSNVGYWIAFTGNDVYKEGAFSIDYDMENKLCVDGLEHKLIYREASLEKKCGPYYIKNFYECEVCHKMYSDIRMENRIRDKEEYVINVPHEYKNYISDNNDSDKTHGTKTAHCIYNCGSTDTIYDNDLSMHHKYVQKIKKATLEEDGLITSECELCHVINIDENKIIIPHIKSINIENEVEYTGKKVEPEVVIIDNEDNKVSKNNYDISYSHNENIGIGVAKIKFKNYYTNDDDENKEVEISRDFKIVPERVKIKKIEKDGRKISISIERGSGRINEVEVLINDKFSKTFKKNDKDEYSIRLNEINEDIKNIKIRVVRYDNVTGEALYSPWVEGEVE